MSEQKSKKFTIECWNTTYEFELFNIEYIKKRLEEYKNNGLIKSVVEIAIPDQRGAFKNFDSMFETEENKYFSYIKFFEDDGVLYGLVGGKTNYRNRDISFDYECRNRSYARHFLCLNNRKWHRTILVVNHLKTEQVDLKEDEQQAYYLETFLQREFNLFNS